ncbi:hypothetical protein EYF80_056830 [Liparis tanakae]|uniref:Uncharacterized protein n=1 Tax=Liparis tanakae TaxID=230148 RepID=A0A4Z2EWK4_9TELE|nr:hypothetical protein EYF80_056830 [Liparis tanakae]
MLLIAPLYAPKGAPAARAHGSGRWSLRSFIRGDSGLGDRPSPLVLKKKDSLSLIWTALTWRQEVTLLLDVDERDTSSLPLRQGGSSSPEVVKSVDFGSGSDSRLRLVSPFPSAPSDHGSRGGSSVPPGKGHALPGSFLALRGKLRSSGCGSSGRAAARARRRKSRYEESSAVKKFSVCVEVLPTDARGGRGEPRGPQAPERSFVFATPEERASITRTARDTVFSSAMFALNHFPSFRSWRALPNRSSSSSPRGAKPRGLGGGASSLDVCGGDALKVFWILTVCVLAGALRLVTGRRAAAPRLPGPRGVVLREDARLRRRPALRSFDGDADAPR